MLKDILAFIGGFAVVGVFGGLIAALVCELRDWIDRMKYNYQVKHRFDKPPTAECYCKDCVRHNNESQRCYKFDGWRTADSWFCWDATPRKKEEK